MLHRAFRGPARKKPSLTPSSPADTIRAIAASRPGARILSGLCVAVLLAFFTLSAVVEAAVDDTPPAAHQAHRQQAEIQTMALARLISSYHHADKADKANLLNTLIDQTKVRQALLGQMVQTDPLGAMRALLPQHVRTGMPTEVQELLEQKQELQGELEVSYEDYEDGRFKLRHILKTDTGRVELQLVNPARAMQSGMRVRARGWLFTA